MPKFKIEQIALAPRRSDEAIRFMKKIGITDWVKDHVSAIGYVQSTPGANEADLAFNYSALGEARELEVLDYTQGNNWMANREGGNGVSHFGMHCTADELVEWRNFMSSERIKIAQEVNTTEHTNPHIAGKRFYTYVIFDTYGLLGVDLKFIVRRDVDDSTVGAPLGAGQA